MFFKELDGRIPAEEHQIIRGRIRGLIGRAGITWQDVPDLEQQCLVKLVAAAHLFDPSRGNRAAFVSTVAADLCRKELRRRRAKRRTVQPAVSLSTMVGMLGEAPVELSQLISDQEGDNTHRGFSKSQLHRIELKDDVETVIASLPPDLAGLAVRLKTQSVTQIAADSGIPRTTLGDWMTKIQERFDQASLREYL